MATHLYDKSVQQDCGQFDRSRKLIKNDGLFWFFSPMPKVPNHPDSGNDDYKHGELI